MRAVAAEVAGTGVTANAVCPAYVRTDMTDAHDRATSRRAPGARTARRRWRRWRRSGRLIEPEEVAFAVAFFAAPEAGAINGQIADHRRWRDPAMIRAEHFGWEVRDGVGFVTLTGAERKNPLTFESYAELRDTFRALAYDDDVNAVVITGRGGQLLLGRRRARHHRPADRDGHARRCCASRA